MEPLSSFELEIILADYHYDMRKNSEREFTPPADDVQCPPTDKNAQSQRRIFQRDKIRTRSSTKTDEPSSPKTPPMTTNDIESQYQKACKTPNPKRRKL